MKTFFCILLYFVLLFLLAAKVSAKPPKHSRRLAYYERQYRKVCHHRAQLARREARAFRH